MAAWPSTLPRPDAVGYSITPVDQAARTEMEVGSPRVRRRTFARNDKVKVSWEFSDAQLATYRDWLEDGATGAAGGAAWFTVDLAIGTGGIVSTEARFVGTPGIAHLGGLQWRVSGEVEVR